MNDTKPGCGGTGKVEVMYIHDIPPHLDIEPCTGCDECPPKKCETCGDTGRRRVMEAMSGMGDSSTWTGEYEPCPRCSTEDAVPEDCQRCGSETIQHPTMPGWVKCVSCGTAAWKGVTLDPDDKALLNTIDTPESGTSPFTEHTATYNHREER